MGWNLPKVKTRYFHLDLGGGSGSKFFRIFSDRLNLAIDGQWCNGNPAPFSEIKEEEASYLFEGFYPFLPGEDNN